MLKNSSFKRMIISSLVLFFTFCLYKFPKNYGYVIEDENVSSNQVYLIDANNYVSLVNVSCKSYDDKVRDMFEGLVNPGCLPIGFKSYLNGDTKLLNYSIDEGLLKLNFSKEFLDTVLKNFIAFDFYKCISKIEILFFVQNVCFFVTLLCSYAVVNVHLFAVTYATAYI